MDVVLSYCHACLLDDALLTVLPYLQSKGVGVVNASPLSMGLLSPQVAQTFILICTSIQHRIRPQNGMISVSPLCTCLYTYKQQYYDLYDTGPTHVASCICASQSSSRSCIGSSG